MRGRDVIIEAATWLFAAPSNSCPIVMCDKIVIETKEKQGNRQNSPEYTEKVFYCIFR